jgi:hypothetical protein
MFPENSGFSTLGRTSKIKYTEKEWLFENGKKTRCHTQELRLSWVEKSTFVGRKVDFRGQKTDFHGQKSDFRGQKIDFRGQKTDFHGQKTDFRGSKSPRFLDLFS